MQGSNLRLLPCKGSTLPTELIVRAPPLALGPGTGALPAEGKPVLTLSKLGLLSPSVVTPEPAVRGQVLLPAATRTNASLGESSRGQLKTRAGALHMNLARHVASVRLNTRDNRIELLSTGLESVVLPLHQSPQRLRQCGYPPRHNPRYRLEPTDRIELSSLRYECSASPCTPCRQVGATERIALPFTFDPLRTPVLEPTTGFEPVTPSLPRKCSAIRAMSAYNIEGTRLLPSVTGLAEAVLISPSSSGFYPTIPPSPARVRVGQSLNVRVILDVFLAIRR